MFWKKLFPPKKHLASLIKFKSMLHADVDSGFFVYKFSHENIWRKFEEFFRFPQVRCCFEFL